MTDAFPLQWPIHVNRTEPHRRIAGTFTVKPDRATHELTLAVRRSGGNGLVISTNRPLRRDGLPARWVGVKPLVWEPSVIGKPWHSAKAPWGWYYAQWDDETQAWFASLEMGEVEAPIILSPPDVPTIDAAKAAAQADYEARILSALEPDHAREARDAQMRADGRVAGLREAARLVYDRSAGVCTESGSAVLMHILLDAADRIGGDA